MRLMSRHSHERRDIRLMCCNYPILPEFISRSTLAASLRAKQRGHSCICASIFCKNDSVIYFNFSSSERHRRSVSKRVKSVGQTMYGFVVASSNLQTDNPLTWNINYKVLFRQTRRRMNDIDINFFYSSHISTRVMM